MLKRDCVLYAFRYKVRLKSPELSSIAMVNQIKLFFMPFFIDFTLKHLKVPSIANSNITLFKIKLFK